MALVFIPPQMRELSQGRTSVEVSGGNLRQAVADLDRQCPGMAARLTTAEGFPTPGLALAVDGSVTSRGLLTPIGPNSEIHILPAIGGG